MSYTEWSRSEREKTNIVYQGIFMESRKKNGIDEPIFREGIETQTQRTHLWTQWGKDKRNEWIR